MSRVWYQRLRAKAAPDLVLGCYPDRGTGRVALRSVRRGGFRRAVAISSLPDGTMVVDGVTQHWGAVAGPLTTIAVLVVYFLLLAPIRLPRDAINVMILAALLIVGALAGWRLFRWLDAGLRDSVRQRYGGWATPGETLVIVEATIHQSRAVLDVLRGGENTQPAIFIVRPRRAGAGRVAELQRRERLSSDQLRLHAVRLAEQQAGALRERRPRPLWGRLRDCERTIGAITMDLAQAVQLEQTISISAEWLLDNAYVIQRQLAEVRRNLSRQIYDVLPILEIGPQHGQPRAYVLAAELVAVTDADLSEQDVVDFLIAYQKVSPLTMSEIWALPLLVRLALTERLSYLAAKIDDQQHEFEWADFWANRLLVAARRSTDQLLFMIADLAREQSNPSAVFADRLIGQLQGESRALSPVLAWLDLKWDQPTFEAIQLEERRHATDQATIANGIGSLRLLARLDWRDVFEQVSLVEATLRAEPSDVYRRMDFETRDRYRHVVEEIARRSRWTEVAVADAAVEAASATGGDYQGHIGYYLVDAGRPRLESRVGCRIPVRQRLIPRVFRRPANLYLSSIAVGTLLILTIPFALIVPSSPGLDRATTFVLIGLLALVPASELAIQIVNCIAGLTLQPQPLPKLAFADGVPDEWRTLTAVPTLLVSSESIREDLDHLEIRYLANRDANLRFALLADLVDAPTSELDTDAALVEEAARGIDLLNSRYPTGAFTLFWRPRRWSETERCWMGWERKRGKLEELNAWLLDNDAASPETLRPIAGDPSRLRGVRCVITLDTDTQLPHGAGRRLIGALAHPLNRPRLAPDGRRVVGGYTIIQPRVSPSLPSATATRFARVFAGSGGVDPYTRAVSDLYQDVAGEGSYYGKGIYDVETFHRVLGGRFPPARLLSHDLLEGSYVRVGMATDVELYDAFPPRYAADVARQYRWTRGDWQIAAWVGNSVPVAGGEREANPIGALNRWKILDNLRRSLIPATSIGLLLAGWLLAPESAVIWSLLVGLMILAPPALHLIAWVPGQPLDVLASGRTWREQGTSWLRALIVAAFMPLQAFLALDAIARSLWRSFISHRYLLEWQPYKAGRKPRLGEGELTWQVALVSLGSVGAWGVVLAASPSALAVATPFLLPWALASVIVAWLGAVEPSHPERTLNVSDQLQLRRIARETWRYFDDFVGPKTNWLPPDNYQEAPRIELAERTSPTNVGLGLLATLAAHDFGYLTPVQVAERGEATLDTLERLERFEGHLLNWYHTGTLQPLLPRYVSTVDSGNLLASLWALAQGYREMGTGPTLGPEALRGLSDTLALVSFDGAPASELPLTGTARPGEIVHRLEMLFANPLDQPGEIAERLRSALEPARELARALDATYWAAQVERQVLAWL
ncbi:MAG: glycosyl transferase, partial [Chloroflexota bacterium]